MAATVAVRPYWIDPRLQNLPPLPGRKIHLDYHNSQHMPAVTTAFDGDEFGDRLQAAHVDGLVVFGKDMHGYFYYPTRYGPVHPGLHRDLLGEQVAACRKRDIKVYAYYCVTWDNYLAEQHPEWLVWKRDRTTHLPRFDETPAWTALCLTNEDFVRLVLDHSREIISTYDLDGIWYDMPLPKDGECFCRNCMAALHARGLNPFDTAAQRRHKQELLVDWMRRSYELAHSLKPDIQVDQNNQTRLGLGERAPYLDNIDIEALPTAFWGYLYFPTNVRYSRTFGRSVYGQTGRFHRSWADFGGLKHPNQLRTELARIVAQGAHCCIGDQLPPSGRLDRAVYDTIGVCYAEVERLEPYLKQAAPVVEAAILVCGYPLDDFGLANSSTPEAQGYGVLGLTKLLMEHHIQFDIIDDANDLHRYRLLILPDALSVDEGLGVRLQKYLDGGGAIIASHHALRLLGSDRTWANDLGIRYGGESPFRPIYLKLGPALSAELPDYEFALYDGSALWTPESGQDGGALAHLAEPLFQRSPEHYTSHGQTPVDHVTDYAAVLRDGKLAAMTFPIGTSYYCHGYWIYREIFRRLLGEVLPVRLVTTNAPISTEITVTQQLATSDRPRRWMVHVVNFSPNPRAPEHPEYLENPIPLHDVELHLALDEEIVRAYLAPDGPDLLLRRREGGWSVIIPRVEFGAVAILEQATQ